MDRKREESESSSTEEEETLPTPQPDPPKAQSRRRTAGGAAGTSASARGVAKLPLKIRTLDGKTYKIEAKTDWSVRQLKEAFEEWRGEGAANCTLFFKAKRLADDENLSTYRIEADSVIQANFRSTGGDSKRDLDYYSN